MIKPPHVVEIFLQPGDFYFGDRNTRIRTTLGSCVSITLWHPTLLIGGMCHYMLASRPDRNITQLDGKYGEDAVLMFFREAMLHNTNPQDYVVKVFGGGNMFPSRASHLPCKSAPCEQVIDACRNVSCKNHMIGRALLKHHGLDIAAEHLGGAGHRNVIFDIWSGHVWVRHANTLAQAS
ncbi:MAG: chemotaxis protein CheD [Hydrogenophilales bacterium]|nr:chemotaxis protein CheD [Hydrogenophilales bacterium]